MHTISVLVAERGADWLGWARVLRSGAGSTIVLAQPAAEDDAAFARASPIASNGSSSRAPPVDQAAFVGGDRADADGRSAGPALGDPTPPRALLANSGRAAKLYVDAAARGGRASQRLMRALAWAIADLAKGSGLKVCSLAAAKPRPRARTRPVAGQIQSSTGRREDGQTARIAALPRPCRLPVTISCFPAGQCTWHRPRRACAARGSMLAATRAWPRHRHNRPRERATSCRSTCAVAATSTGIIREVFERHGFEPLETPALERLDALLGKYGEEGDQLLFKVLLRGQPLVDGIRKAAEHIAEPGEPAAGPQRRDRARRRAAARPISACATT